MAQTGKLALMIGFCTGANACLSYDSSGPGLENLLYLLLQPWGGTRQLGTSADDGALAITTDASGNIYVVGYTDGSLDGITNPATSTIFLVKYDSASRMQWIRQMGESAGDSAQAVATDSAGYIYITGSKVGQSSTDLFLAKYDPEDGRELWFRQLGSSKTDVAYGISVDQTGNIYLTGETQSEFDGNAHQGGQDIFLAKFSPAGEKLWVRQLGTPSTEFADELAIDSAGNIYIAGRTNGALDGNLNVGQFDIFLVKYNSAGEKKWTRQTGTPNWDLAYGVCIDRADNIYVTGSTGLNFDAIPDVGHSDILLAKFSPDGVEEWRKSKGTPEPDFGTGIKTDQAGNIYISGYTGGNLNGNTRTGNENLLSSDLFLMKLNGAGEEEWISQSRVVGDDKANGLAIDWFGNIFLAGETRGDLDGNTNAGGADVFLLKYDSAGVLQ